MKRKKRQRASHIFDKDQHGHYVEPRWVTERLLQVDTFDGTILDPSCGWGTITHAANAAGHPTIGFDLINRRRHELNDCFHKLDFLKTPINQLPLPPHPYNVICNPPFDFVAEFCAKACSLPGVDKIAMIMLLRRMNAAHWLRDLPLYKVYLLSPRPSMPTGEFIRRVERGEIDRETREPLKVGGGTQDFVWLLMRKGNQIGGPIFLKWLHRDEENSGPKLNSVEATRRKLK